MRLFIVLVVMIATCLSVVSSRQVNVLIVGVSGSGKSSLVSNVADIVGISEYKATPVTRDVKVYEAAYNIGGEDVDIHLVDTMGFASTDLTTDIIKKMENIILEPTIITSIHKVVILIKAERNSINSLNELNNVIKVLQAVGLKQANILTYITHMDIYDSKTKNLMKGAVAKHYEEIMDLHPQVKCFANPSEMDEEVQPTIKKWVDRDIKEFIHKVVEHVVPFYPNDYKTCKDKMSMYSYVLNLGYEQCLKDVEEARNAVIVKGGKRKVLEGN